MSSPSFLTRDGVTVPSVTASEMREVDRMAIERFGPNLYQMMENAGRSLASTVIEQLGSDWNERPIVVLSGTGGNGGGGVCAARHLANRGADVSLVLTDQTRLDGIPADQLSIYEGTDGRVMNPKRLGSTDAAMVVDAIIGYSLGGAPRGVAADMIAWTVEHGAPVVALDVPSGVDATTGETPGAHIEAQLTMTLALPKAGLAVPAVGRLWLADIGIPIEVYRTLGLEVSPSIFGDRFRVPLRHTALSD